MSTSRHPIAYRLEGLIGGEAKLLATVMGLPLVDGIFAAIVIAGGLDDPLRIVETGLLIFGGSATVAVILAEMDGTPRDHVGAILTLGAVLLPLAAIEAAIAPVIGSLLDLIVFERFAALVILAIAAKTASAQVGELLPSPGTIIGLGLLASVQPSQLSEMAQLSEVIQPDPVLMGKAAASAGVGVVFALGVALAGPRLRGRVDLDRFRFGSSVALGMLAVSVLELPALPTNQPIALYVLLVTAVLSYDADGSSGFVGGLDDGDDADDATGEAGETDPATTAEVVADDAGSEPGDSPAGGTPEATPTPAAGGKTVAGGGTAAEEASADDSPSNATTADELDDGSPGVDRSERANEPDGSDGVNESELPEESDSDNEPDSVDEPDSAEASDAEDDAEESQRQADEEYGQSRAPWL